MALDEPSAQLHAELRAAIQSALASRRPLIHHLNADTSWLLQIPRPDSAVKHGGRFYYNILIDPWLQGGQSDVASWFSQQHHAIPSAVGSIAEVEELAREIEVLAAGLRLGYARKTNAAVDAEDGTLLSFIDAVTISHEFTVGSRLEKHRSYETDIPVSGPLSQRDIIENRFERAGIHHSRSRQSDQELAAFPNGHHSPGFWQPWRHGLAKHEPLTITELDRYQQAAATD